MDEVESNGQIIPEMLYEIRKCRFLIMDAILANLEAYYEAGYAAGRGKQVILSCKKDKYEGNEKSHLQSTIIWNDEADLCKKLKKRIEATVRKLVFRIGDPQ